MEYLEFRVFARQHGELCDPLGLFIAGRVFHTKTLQQHSAWMYDASSGLSLAEIQNLVALALRPQREGAAEADEAGGVGASVEVSSAGGGGALLVRAGADDVGQMQELRDRVLSGEFDAAVARALGPDARWSLHADRTEFAEQYELALRTLTPHQREKLEERECAEDGQGVDVHLRAPAGAGKTFVALHWVLDALQAEPSARALFVARNEALACFAASWLGKRVRGGRRRRELLARLHLLYEPFDEGVREVAVRDGCVVIKARDAAAGGEAVAAPAYALVVVDEAHHLYSDPVARSLVEGQVTAGCTRRLLLSDISQSLGRGVAYPEGLREVVLSEVVRCSKRIVAGAMAFQLGGEDECCICLDSYSSSRAVIVRTPCGHMMHRECLRSWLQTSHFCPLCRADLEEKLLTKCHREAAGPPLQPFLFDLPASKPEEADCGFFEAYADHTVRALEHVVAAFPGLSLHNRLAIVVRDRGFLEAFRPALQSALEQRLPDRQLRLVSAAVASADLGAQADDGIDEGPEGEDSTPAPSDLSREMLDEASGASPRRAAEEWLVMDTVHQIDGLEFLVVVGVGLDSPIRGEEPGTSMATEEDTGSKALQARSMLYRAVTRAHLMFLVVNEFLRGGWLEFLDSVRLRDDEESLMKIVVETAIAYALGLEFVDYDTPLVDSGMDSFQGLALRKWLQSLTNMTLPASFTYDNPTQRSIVGCLIQRSKEGAKVR